MRCLGDSFTLGAGASVPGYGYVGRLTPTILAGSGDQAADLSNRVCGVGNPPKAGLTIDVAERYCVLIGGNDVRQYGVDAAKQAVFVRCLRASLAWLAWPTKTGARSMSPLGAWSNTVVNTFGRVSTVAGSSLTGTFTGDVLYVGFILQNHANLGTANVFVDGNLVGQLSTYAPVNTQNGATYAGGCERFANLGAGPHMVSVVVTSPLGQSFYLDWVAGAEPSPIVAVCDIPRMSASAYARFPPCDDALVAVYNALLAGVVAELAQDGADIRLASLALDPALHLCSDGVHPNDLGHLCIEGALLGAVA